MLRPGGHAGPPVEGTFDAVLCWFTSFGYFEDDDNRRVLAEFRRVLRPGGRLPIETLSRDGFVRTFVPDPFAAVTSVGDDLMVDRTRFDPTSHRLITRRTVVRDGRVRHSQHFVRLPTLPELRSWLTGAGFADVSFCGRGGAPLTLDSRRLVVLATA